MKTYIRIITILTTAAILTSCGLALLDNNETADASDGNLIISGTIAENHTNTALKGIKVTLEAFPLEARTNIPSTTTSVYSDSRGCYMIEAQGLSGALRCEITAESVDLENMPYESSMQEINVNWNGTAFDKEKNTFVANNCDFKLARIR